MTERLTWKTAQMRAAAIIAKEQNVSIELKPDGTIVISPETKPLGIRIPKGGIDL